MVVLFAIGLAVPSVFAEHSMNATVENAMGSSTPGCEPDCFIPATVTIGVGGQVTFANNDAAAHTSTSGTSADGPDGVWDSSLVMMGSAYTTPALDAGEYPYFCMVHPWMVGLVIVDGSMYEVSTNPTRTSFETYSNQKYGFTINIPSTWETEELDLFDGEVTNVVNFYSPEGDVITILKEYELWSAPINPSTIKQTANMFILGIKEECNKMTIARDGITCTNVELTKAQKGMVGTIDSTDIFYTIDYEDYEYYYAKTALAKIWNDPADNTAWFVMGFTNDESSEYANFFKSIDSLKISKSTTQPVIRTTNYVNEQYGFSVTPPSGWDTQIFEDIYIDSKSQPGEQFRALATYQMLNSNAQYVVPTMGIMVMETQQKIDWSTDPDGSAFAEDLLYGIESTGSTGNLLSSNLEKIPNGFHASFTADLGMNVGLQTLIPTKAAGEAWIFDDGLLVMYVYQAERSEYNKFLQDYKNSVNTFFFKPRAIEQSTQPTQTSSSEGGGCLIATAAFGSEMAPQVQFLRELRDNKVLQTTSGTTFMNGFNQFYYSFSPAVADYERENPVFKEMVKVSLTPLLTSLTLLNYVEIDSEEEMLGYGIGIILLNVGIYFVAPAVLIISLKKRLDSFRGHKQ